MHRSTFGKTYEEIFGEERAKEMHLLRKSCRKEKYIPSLATQKKQSKARKAFVKNNPEIAYYNATKATLGKTYEEISGVEKAKIRREKQRRSRVEQVGEERAAEIAKVIQEKRLAWFNSLTPDEARRAFRFGGYTRTKYGVREDLKCYFRSAWEANVARLLNYLNVRWEYEKYTFKLVYPNGERHFYTPDFFLPELNLFIEVKGWGSIENFTLFKDQYSETACLIGEQEYMLLTKEYQYKIPYWER